MRDECAHIVRNSLLQMKSVLGVGKVYYRIGNYSAIQSWMFPQFERLIGELDRVFANCLGGCCAEKDQNKEG
jgi:hypothetical protein